MNREERYTQLFKTIIYTGLDKQLNDLRKELEKSTRALIFSPRRRGKTYLIAKMVVAEMLTNTQKKFIIGVPISTQITPIQEQIYKELTPFVDYISLYRRSEKDNRIELKNGSCVEIIPAPRIPYALRGKRADMVIIDEADYMKQEDVESFYIISLQRAEIKFFMFSTPSYEDDSYMKKLYFNKLEDENCITRKLTWEHYCRTDIDWMMNELKQIFNEESFRREILCEF